MASIDVLTNRYDNLRSGVNAAETILTPDTVSSPNFGVLFRRDVDGDVYTQPLVVTGLTIPGVGVRDVVYVATVNNSLYAFDASDPTRAAPYWHQGQSLFGPPVPKDEVYPPGFGDFAYQIGITSTPVIDRTTSTIYVLAKSLQGGQFHHRLFGLDLVTGTPKFGGPAEVEALVSGMSFERKATLTDTAIGGPALADLGGQRLGLGWTGNEALQRVNVATSADGQAFTGKVILGESAVDGPALAFGNGRGYLAWTGNETARRLNVMSSPDLTAGSFAPKVTLAASSAFGPALAFGNGRLFLAWTDAGQRLNVMSSTDGSTFGGQVTLGETAVAAPALAFLGGRLYLVWSGPDPNHQLNVISSIDGVTFTGKVTLVNRSTYRAAVAGTDLLRLAWTGVSANQPINVVTAPAGSTAFAGQVSYDGGMKWGVDQSTNTNRSAGGVALVTFQGRLCFGWTGNEQLRRLNVTAGLPFDPKRHLNRPGLLLHDGVVYLACGSHGDQPPYHGWVLGYDATTLRQVSAYTPTPDTFGGGIWQSGAGLSSDGRFVYAVVGNAHNGGADQGNAILQLDPTNDLRLRSAYGDPNANNLSDQDLDLTTCAVIVPDGTGQHTVIAAGKNGVCYILSAAPAGGLALRQHLQGATSYHPPDQPNIHGSPVVWDGGSALGVRMYLWGEFDHLRMYRRAGPTFTLAQISDEVVPPGMPGGFLTLSVNGTDPATAVVWASVPKGNANKGTVDGRLLAFRASDVQQPLWNSDTAPGGQDTVGKFAKFCPPTIANGKVYVPTLRDPANPAAANHLVVYGMRP